MRASSLQALSNVCIHSKQVSAQESREASSLGACKATIWAKSTVLGLQWHSLDTSSHEPESQIMQPRQCINQAACMLSVVIAIARSRPVHFCCGGCSGPDVRVHDVLVYST